MNRINKGLFWTGLVVSMLMMCALHLQVSAQTIFTSPYVTFSPDGKAWTTNAGEKNTAWYEAGKTVYTGIASGLRELRAGEHYYSTQSSGTVPIGYWRVEHTPARCIHAQKRYEGVQYHDLQFRRENCYRSYYSGWSAYCADCGQKAAGFIYMSEECARTISYLPADMEYYYLCPHCTNLEQGAPFSHICKNISANRYKVRYCRNAGNAVGYMEEDYFFYDNAAEYEGSAVTPKSRLTLCGFSREGYLFAGWNTEADGSGLSFADGAEILNLSDENWERGSEQGIVKLYAMWTPAESVLQIDPNGGRYEGRTGIVSKTGQYGSRITLSTASLEPPAGWTVSFETGTELFIKPMTAKMLFSGWQFRAPMHGRFRNDTYYYTGGQGDVDLMTACYLPGSILLPTPEDGDSRFAGWYFDREKTVFAGRGGDVFTPTSNVTLYAGWSELKLESTPDYLANEGKGAVDLEWTMFDAAGKTFRVFQKTDADWKPVGSDGGGISLTEQKEWRPEKGAAYTYEVPSTGMYRLSAIGAAGESCGDSSGGKGGIVTAVFWLSRGEQLTIKVGSSDSGNKTPGGFSSGGERTLIESNLQGTLLAAGGGGGATVLMNGGDGGLQEMLRENGLSAGEAGQAGGGAGFVGGSAGAVVYHSHENCSRHEHSGDCYERHIHSDACYRDYVIVLSNDARVDLPCGCCSQVHHFLCTKCGRVYSSMTYNSMYCREGHNGCQVINYGSSLCHSRELTCGMAEKEYLICTREEGWTCGKTEGVDIDRAVPSYGGSNYVKSTALSVLQNGTTAIRGQGSARLETVAAGFVQTLSLEDAAAPDTEPPFPVDDQTMTLRGISEGTVRICWERPEDRGTVYYHKVVSYLFGDDQPVLESNITTDTICTGVKGYFYLVDGLRDSTVLPNNGIYTGQQCAEMSFASEGTVQYLHVAAVDAAGNLGETTHFRVEYSSDTDQLIQWNLKTKQIEIENGRNVYQADRNHYYVKADGETPFILTAGGYTEGPATSRYQPNYAAFEVEEAGDSNQLRYYIPSDPVSEADLDIAADSIEKSMVTCFPLETYPLLTASRTNRNRGLEVRQGFVMPETDNGECVAVLPRIGAETEGRNTAGDPNDTGEILWSDRAEDRLNAIYLTADGAAPVLTGDESIWENAEAVREGRLGISLTASDAGSGLAYLRLKVTNSDNACEEIFYGTEGRLTVTADPDEPLWQGSIRLEVEAEDNVGNLLHKEYSLGGILLEAQVTRVLEPHLPVFKAGEGGLVRVQVTGYVKELEVIFPESFTSLSPNMNQKTVLQKAEYSLEAEIPFSVPLYAPPGEKYPVLVRTNDGNGNYREKILYLSVIGTSDGILGELRTRLR